MRPAPPSTSLQRTVVTELGREIGTGRIAAGDLLVPEEVARRFEVSRTVVREAFRSLEARGMIRARHRSGTRVTPTEHWNLLDPEVIGWRDSGPDARRQLDELLVLREAVEPAAAALVAVHANAAEVAALVEHAERMRAALSARRAQDYVDADEDFHRIVIAASGNAVLGQLLQTIGATVRSRYRGSLPVFTECTAQAVERHRRLAEAVAGRDPVGASAEARELVREARTEVTAAHHGI